MKKEYLISRKEMKQLTGGLAGGAQMVLVCDTPNGRRSFFVNTCNRNSANSDCLFLLNWSYPSWQVSGSCESFTGD
jgi:hypothetical protein